MDRAQLLLFGLPIFLLCSDLFNLFTPPPPKPSHKYPDHHHHHHQPQSQSSTVPPQPLEFPTDQRIGGIGDVGAGNTVDINFCASCSYRGNAVNMKKMLEMSFPGITVNLANYPPALPKRILSKIVPVFQFGLIGIVMAGEQIFPKLGLATPPQWYFTLRANRFGTISTAWLLGNFAQSFLQSSGAFEVYCNGVPVFSKLQEHRFPGEIELKDIIGKRIASSNVGEGFGGKALWS